MTDSSSDSDFELPPVQFRKTKGMATSTATSTSSSADNTIDEADASTNNIDLLIEQPVFINELTQPGFQNISMQEPLTLPQITESQQTPENFTFFRQADTPTVTLRLSPNCMVCYDREPNAFFFPCGHTACTVCAVFLQENSQKCPQCRKCITEVKPIFNE